jgi:ATP/maltotriose-dependent transcriptional regulator MalT
MGENQEHYQFSQRIELVSPKVLSNFDISNHRYVVICVESNCATFTEISLNKFPKHLLDSMVGQLQLNNQYCIIVEVEANVIGDDKSDITMLLTERELQIVQLIAQGQSNKQIAHRLHISTWTVSTHLRRVFAKLDVDSRAAMVHRCSSLLNNLEQLI